MTPLAALALAVRDRLTAGAEAPLPGIGTLACAHVSARVRVGPDGQRVMLPPGESVGLLTRAGDPTDLAQAVARHAGAAPASAVAVLRDAVDQLDARLAITGDARLDGVGLFQRTSSGIRFAAALELLAAVNRPYEGLAPVTLGRADVSTPATSPPAAPPPAAAPVSEPLSVAPPGAVDILLDLIVNEPAEAEAPTAPPDAPPAETSPMQSAFADDALPPPRDAASLEQPAPKPTAPEPDAPEPTASESDATADAAPDDDPGIAVPFGTDGETLHDRLPPTPDEPDVWQRAPSPDVDGGTRPLDRPDIEDAELVDAAEADAEPVDAEPDGPAGFAATPDVQLAAFDAAVAAGSAPPIAASPPAGPATPEADGDAVRLADIYTGDPEPTSDVLPEARSPRRGWAVFGAIVVLAIASLALSWWIATRRAPARTVAPAVPAAPVRALPVVPPDTVSADSLGLAPDSLATDSSALATGRP